MWVSGEYSVGPDGRVYIKPVQDDPDPALCAFFDFIETDITANPQRLSIFGGALYDKLSALIGGVEVDLDATLSPDNE